MVLPVTDLGFGFEGFLATAEAWDSNSMLGRVDAFFPQEFVNGLSTDAVMYGKAFHRGKLVPVFDDDVLLGFGCESCHRVSPLDVYSNEKVT